MWRAEIGPTKERLLAKIATAKRQLANIDTPTLQLEVSLAGINQLVARLEGIKAEVSEDTTTKRKRNCDFDPTLSFSEIIELILDAEDITAELSVKIESKNSAARALTAVSGSATNSNYRSSGTSTKLPKLSLKKFDGDITQFIEFWETFTLAVDETDLDEIQKYVYLKSLLSGEAEKLISGLSTTKQNYVIAKNLLMEKYGDKKRVIQKLYQQLNAIPKATKSTLRQTYDNLEAILRSLETEKENIEGGALLSIIAAKYPEDILSKVLEANNALSVAALRETVKTLTLRKEQLESFTKLDSSSATTSSPKFTTEALLTKARTSYQQKKICRYCSGAHWSDECNEYSTISARKAKIKGSCFICLREGHNLKKCNMKKKCVYCKQEANHHRSLCSKKFPPENSEPLASTSAESTTANKTVSCFSNTNTSLAKNKSGLLMTAVATVFNANHQCTVRVIFDNGSQRSYITKKLANQLHLKENYAETLNISTFGSSGPLEVDTRVVAFHLQLDNGKLFEVFANTVPKITNHFYVEFPPEIQTTASQQQLKLADDCRDGEIEILLGMDYYFHLVNEKRMQVAKDLFLVQSELGWLVGGSCGNTCLLIKETPCLLTIANPPIKQLWELDTIGIKNIEDDRAEEEALKIFYESITYKNHEYTVAWPWSEYPPNLETNYALALGRLKTLLKKLPHNQLVEYDKIIQNQLQQKIVEKVDKNKPAEICHYLPHHSVLTPEKSTPQRIVYDGSAKTKKSNKSLNNCLLKGKVLLEHIAALLLRFQFHEFVIIADIEKAFLRIGLHERDRDTTRFLWLKNINNPATDENLEIFRFTKIPFGVVSTPFLLSATIHYHLTNSDSELAAKILSDFYVDNLITGVSQINEGKWLYKETKKIFSEASMNLRNYKSNSIKLNKYFGADEDSNSTLSILSIVWDSKSDTLHIKPCKISKAKTKREVLQITSSIFDPLGWFSPIVLQAKEFIKQLWCEQIDWDKILTTEQQNQWENIYAELLKISTFQISRLKKTSESPAILHAFVDASKVAYAAVIYLQQENDINLLFAKSRVTPQKPTTLTIPRLELLAVLIGVRILKFTKDSLSSVFNIEETFLWSDSKVALSWIHSKKVLPAFVEHRAREIRKNKDIQMRYVPSAHNPADIASRGCTYEQLQLSNWWKGPSFLKLHRNEWPIQQQNFDNFEYNLQETPPSCLLTTETNEPLPPYEINAKKFYCFSRLLNTTSACLKAVQIFRAQTYPDKIHRREQAKILWLQYEQKMYFADIFTSLKKNKPHNLQKRLELWIDQNNLLRCKGRLQEAAHLSYDEKYPILLPTKGYLSKLIVMYFHSQNHHVGTMQTLAEVRKFYWIPQGRAMVFNTIRTTCMVCKYFHAKFFKAPPVPPLYQFRVTPTRPFKFTGVDVFGPLFVQSFTNEDRKEKVWCMLFTCLITRAIHLEILPTMTTEDFLLSIRCFMAPGRTPTLFLSDNAPQFKLLADIFESSTKCQLQNFLEENGIRWKFIPALSPWMGGIYERLVGLVKQSLRKSLFKMLLTSRQLQAVLAEISGTLNRRPLTYVGSEQGTVILTPEKLIYAYVEDDLPEFNLDRISQHTTPTCQQLVSSWKKSQAAVSHFWNIWKSSYLLSLRERYITLQQPNRVSETSPQVGQTVIVADENLPRSMWKLAEIVSLIESQDGNIRSAQIKYGNGVTLIRPITKLCPLELRNEEVELTPTTADSHEEDTREEFDLEEIEVEEVY